MCGNVEGLWLGVASFHLPLSSNPREKIQWTLVSR